MAVPIPSGCPLYLFGICPPTCLHCHLCRPETFRTERCSPPPDIVRYSITGCSSFYSYIEYAPSPHFHMKIWPCFLPRYVRNRDLTIYGREGRCPLRGFLKIVTNRPKKKKRCLPLSPLPYPGRQSSIKVNLKRPWGRKQKQCWWPRRQVTPQLLKGWSACEGLISFLPAFCVPPSPRPAPHRPPLSITVNCSVLRCELMMR